MKKLLVGGVLVAWLALSTPVYAGVTDWPVIGQISRVAVCVVKGGAGLLGSLFSHLSAWGGEVVQTVGHCALNTVDNTTEVVGGVVTLTPPTPSTTEAPVAPTTEVIHE